MCAVVDGYKLFRVYDTLGIATSVAAYGQEDALHRATLRGVPDPQYCQWHECYGEYALEFDEIERAVMRVQIREMIFTDIGEHP